MYCRVPVPYLLRPYRIHVYEGGIFKEELNLRNYVVNLQKNEYESLGCLHTEVAWMPRRGTLHKTHLIFAWHMSLEKANQRF
jgi:hypothetical protein